MPAPYNDPEILILDGSTSALDKENEQKIMNDLVKLKNKDITIIMISHRESIKNCDQHISLDNLRGLKT